MGVDEYIVGRPARISREAPVLILHHSQTFIRPGAATNAAQNLATLGARTTVVGVVGDDENGARLRSLLQAAGMDVRGLLVDPNRPTSTKTRILAKGTQEVQQQIVRVDRVDSSSVDGALRDQMIDCFRALASDAAAVLISDYDNGVISQEVLDACLPAVTSSGKIVTVDSHGDLFRFHDVTAATPNQPEAELTVGFSISSQEDLCRAGRKLLTGMDAKGVLITRGSEGIALFEHGRAPYLLPVATPDTSQVVDPNGAGDTVSAVFTLALAGGASMRLAAYMSDIAGGEVVRHAGPVGLTPAQLRSALRRTHLSPPSETYNESP
jgi:rfaE bifunctional protein kinase chain/domain